MTQPISKITPQSSIMSPIVVALDKPSLNEALQVADSLDPALCRVKVGKELFTRAGPEVVRQLQQRGFDVFLDLKFHDIPNTTAQAVLAAADLGVWMVNVHTWSGSRAMALAKSGLVTGNYDTLLIGVTVLTSMDTKDLRELGVIGNQSSNNTNGIIVDTPVDDLVDDYIDDHVDDHNNSLLEQQVIRLAGLAQKSGLDGIVCSANEAKGLKKLYGADFKLVTPGIRMLEDSADDQQRICTPKQALNDGSDYLVIGRSITQAPDPVAKIKVILDSLRA